MSDKWKGVSGRASLTVVAAGWNSSGIYMTALHAFPGRIEQPVCGLKTDQSSACERRDKREERGQKRSGRTSVGAS